jgi:AraC family transcriptional regulator
LQNLNTRIWSEWLPSLKGYELAGKYNIEVYGSSTDNPKDKGTYIWIPLRKI